jgi:hypothetical protein
MSAIQPGARTESVLPEELRPQSHRIEMGLQELSRTQEWRSLAPYLKRILTSYLTEDARDMIAAVARYRVGWNKEQIAADAERLSNDPLVVTVLQIQRGEIRK